MYFILSFFFVNSLNADTTIVTANELSVFEKGRASETEIENRWDMYRWINVQELKFSFHDRKS